MKRRIRLPSGQVVGGAPKVEKPKAPPPSDHDVPIMLQLGDIPEETRDRLIAAEQSSRRVMMLDPEQLFGLPVGAPDQPAVDWNAIFGAPQETELSPIVRALEEAAERGDFDDEPTAQFPPTVSGRWSSRHPQVNQIPRTDTWQSNHDRLTERLRRAAAARIQDAVDDSYVPQEPRSALSYTRPDYRITRPEPAPPIPEEAMEEIFDKEDEESAEASDYGDFDPESEDPNFEAFDDEPRRPVVKPKPRGIVKRTTK